MKALWSGEISLDGEQKLKNICLSGEGDSATCLPSQASLRFLSVVATTRVPLYMTAGRPYEVTTSSEETASWFSSILLGTRHVEDGDSMPWWQTAVTDSPLGVLVSVNEPLVSVKQASDPRITELLFYIAKDDRPSTRPLTPPQSSPNEGSDQEQIQSELRVWGLPLSSDLLQKNARAEPTPPQSPSLDAEDIEPVFLPRGSGKPNKSSEVINRPPVRKRKSATDAFDEATERRRKAKKGGGGSVAAAAAVQIKSEDSLPTLKHRRSVSNAQVPLQSRPLSRSSSVASTRPTGLREPSVSAISKPSALSQTQSASAGPTVPVEPTIESKNKELVSKMVMAGMRMFGLHQSKSRKSRANSTAASPAVDVSFEELEADRKNDDEFKLIYHQVNKGTCFAFREHLAKLSLQPRTDVLRDTVDRLLGIFCTDPLAVTEGEATDEYTPGGRKAFGSSALPASEKTNPFPRAPTMSGDSMANTPSDRKSKKAESKNG